MVVGDVGAVQAGVAAAIAALAADEAPTATDEDLDFGPEVDGDLL